MAYHKEWVTELETDFCDPGFCSLVWAPCQYLRALSVSCSKIIDKNLWFQIRQYYFLFNFWIVHEGKKNTLMYKLYFFIVMFHTIDKCFLTGLLVHRRGIKVEEKLAWDLLAENYDCGQKQIGLKFWISAVWYFFAVKVYLWSFCSESLDISATVQTGNWWRWTSDHPFPGSARMKTTSLGSSQIYRYSWFCVNWQNFSIASRLV